MSAIVLGTFTAFGCSSSAPVRIESTPTLPVSETLSSQSLKLDPFAKIQKEEPFYTLSLSPTGRYLALGGINKILVWDVKEKMQLHNLTGPERDVISLAFSPDSSILAAGSYKTIDLWDVIHGQKIITLSGHADYVQSLSFSPDGGLLASGSRGPETAIYIWDMAERKLLKRLDYRTRYAEMVRSLAFNSDGTLLASVGLDRTIRIWEVKKDVYRLQQMLFDPMHTPLTLSFSPDQKILTAGTSEGIIVAYDLITGKVLRTMTGHHGEVLSLAFSPDGKTIISAGQDNVLRRWDVETGRAIDSKGLNFEIQAVQIAKGGTLAAAIGPLGTAVFDLQEKKGTPPVVTIITPDNQQTVDQPTTRLTGKVIDDIGVTNVKIQVNDVSILKTSSGQVARDLIVESEKVGREVILDEEIPLRVGKNIITVIAYDLEGQSQTVSVEIVYLPEQGQYWAAVIGISKYKHVGGLRYADKDAIAFYDYLVNDNQIPKDHITLLLNEEATHQRLRDVLGIELRTKARKQDTVIIYYAGHGAPEPDRGSPDGDGLEKYILPYDADPRRLYSTALPMSEISRVFSRLSAERVVLIQDTCYSGSSEIGGRTIQTAAFRSSISEAFMDRLARGEGRIIMTSSEANEVSIERDDLGHGVFTYYFLEAFSKGDRDGDGLITTSEAYRYVSRKVPDATGQNQHPVRRGEERKGEIILGKVKSQQQ